MRRVLVIEDDEDLLEVLDYNLRQAGHDVVSVTRGQDGLRLALDTRHDLVILDLMLPDMPGTEVCKALKADVRTRHVPILMLTAKSDEIDRVVGFELGAEDYVTKPFSMRELLLRIRVILRRNVPLQLSGAVSCTEAPQDSSGTFACGLLRVNPDAHQAWVGEAEVALTAMEFRFLLTLYTRRARVLTRAVLLRDLWGITANQGARTIDTLVKRLREKLGHAGACIETVRGVGYRFAEGDQRCQPLGETR